MAAFLSAGGGLITTSYPEGRQADGRDGAKDKAEPVDKQRRRLLIATSIAGSFGGLTVSVPFLSSLAPSERAKAAGAPVELDITGMRPGEWRSGDWRGKPVVVVCRSPEMLASLPKNHPELADPKSERKPDELTPSYARNEHRSIKPEYFVCVNICSHLGCAPTPKLEPGAQSSLPPDWPGGFLCPCHGSTFDVAGRVFKNKPAPDNLQVPPHRYLSETKLLIGEDAATA
jgi:ubiquinol-cytochrome c reductase iron-sulfur subunit